MLDIVKFLDLLKFILRVINYRVGFISVCVHFVYRLCIVFCIVFIMALIIGDGQIKYFSKYVQDSRIQMYYSSGCRVEELVHLPAMKEAIPAASVSIN